MCFFKHLLRYVLFIDFIYPYGIAWDSFIQFAIQRWEDFYIQWIRHGKSIFVIYPDNFINGEAIYTSKNLTNFMDFEWNESRLNCSLKRQENKFSKRKQYSEKNPWNATTKRFIASSKNYCAPNQTYTLNIYSKKHFIWINSSIKTVKHELEKRNFDTSYISSYQTDHFRVYVCPEFY